MNHRRRHFLLGLVASLVVARPVSAQNAATDSVIEQLRAQGYRVVEVSRTLLGRVRVLAHRRDMMREIVFDPRNGVVLRDYTFGSEGPRINDDYDLDDDEDDDAGGDDDGGGDDDDDDEDEDGDDEDDDDEGDDDDEDDGDSGGGDDDDD